MLKKTKNLRSAYIIFDSSINCWINDFKKGQLRQLTFLSQLKVGGVMQDFNVFNPLH